MGSWRLTAGVLGMALLATACTNGGDEPTDVPTETDVALEDDSTRARVVTRGVLNCGFAGDRPGFSEDVDGTIVGLDVEFCRAVAAAVLGDADRVDLQVLTAQEQFTALAAGNIDVLLGSQVTATADGVEAVTFATPTFYDGDGILVLEESEIQSLAELEGLEVCRLGAQDDPDRLAARGVTVNTTTYPDVNQLLPVFEASQCVAATASLTSLAEVRASGSTPMRYLPVGLSRIEHAPATHEADTQWSQIVDWTIRGMLIAEELGVSSTTIGDQLASDNPAVQRLLGIGDDAPFDAGLGLPDEWAQVVIRDVGNYAEVYERSLGDLGAVNVPRGPSGNELWNRGGLHVPSTYS